MVKKGDVQALIDPYEYQKNLDVSQSGLEKAKVEGKWTPVIVAFTRAIVRFFMGEVWSWLP